ncbi:MAG: hypothetical protein LBQ69_07120 [Treponema sp.]|jgi:diaminopimelate epimerase|nr:hypothetical protein [Treponema sp.]
MEMDIVRADPAGNITIFVLGLPGGMDRAAAARALLADPGLKAEQVGFALPPSKPGGLWRLEMAGGEFCGNASRGFGLLVAARTGLSGRHSLMIETSGVTRPLPVHIDTEAGTAEIEMPPPLAQTSVSLEGRRCPVYEFEGITHAIAENIQPDERVARSIIGKLGEGSLAEGKRPSGALGVMFYDSRKRFMRPFVWTRELDALVAESSCGSGSAALGAWAARNAADAELEIDLEQPGGTITVRVAKRAGKITRLSIGGKVTLSNILTKIYCEI